MLSTAFLAASVALLARATVADEYTGQGNVDMTIGTNDPPVHFGDQTPWSVLDTLNQHCNSQTCDSDPWTIPTSMVNDAAGTNDPNNINEGTITVTVVDATIGHGDDTAGMIEALKGLSAQTQIYSVAHEYYCYDDSLAPPAKYKPRAAPGTHARRDFGCNNPDNGTPIDSYSTAATWYIRVNNDDGSLRSELRINIQAGVNDDALSQTICTDLTTAGGAVAGLFTGGAAAAAGFALAGLVCGAV